MVKHNRKSTMPGFHPEKVAQPKATFTFNEEDVRDLAHHLWLARGGPEGSPEVDWERALLELQARGKKERG